MSWVLSEFYLSDQWYFSMEPSQCRSGGRCCFEARCQARLMYIPWMCYTCSITWPWSSPWNVHWAAHKQKGWQQSWTWTWCQKWHMRLSQTWRCQSNSICKLISRWSNKLQRWHWQWSHSTWLVSALSGLPAKTRVQRPICCLALN